MEPAGGHHFEGHNRFKKHLMRNAMEDSNVRFHAYGMLEKTRPATAPTNESSDQRMDREVADAVLKLWARLETKVGGGHPTFAQFQRALKDTLNLRWPLYEARDVHQLLLARRDIPRSTRRKTPHGMPDPSASSAALLNSIGLAMQPHKVHAKTIAPRTQWRRGAMNQAALQQGYHPKLLQAQERAAARQKLAAESRLRSTSSSRSSFGRTRADNQ